MKVKINVDIYSCCVYFATTEEEFIGFKSGDKPSGLFVTREFDGAIYVLVTQQWDSHCNPLFIQCVAHEMNHAAMDILGQCGVLFNYENQEALCYLQDFLMSRVFKALEKQNSISELQK